MAFTRPTATTRIAPDEAQGHARSRRLSKEETGLLFAAGSHAANPTADIRPGVWGDGTEKPCCSSCEAQSGNHGNNTRLGGTSKDGW